MISSKPIEKLPAMLLNNLRLGVFQLQHMPDIPPAAVLKTCGDLARAVGHPGQVRFVNALLRNYLRKKIKDTEDQGEVAASCDTIDRRGEPQAFLASDSHKKTVSVCPEAHDLASTYSMPQWIIERWLKNYGQGETVKLLAQAQQPGKLILRPCVSTITVEALETLLQSQGFIIKRGSLVPACLIIERSSNKKSRGAPQNITGYDDGFFSIQDESSAFVSIVVDPQPGETVVDLCAAPGGKTIHLAELMSNSGQVIAVDKDESRLDLIKVNRKRLGLTNVQILKADGRTVNFNHKADRVLLDAPCMGTGVLSKRPDLRYHRKPEDTAKLVALQRELLHNAATLIKPGGVLVYSTCSIEPEENIENMRWFLEQHKDFTGSDLTPYIPQNILREWASTEQSDLDTKTVLQNARQGFIQLLPSKHGVSGFFLCRMFKRS